MHKTLSMKKLRRWVLFACCVAPIALVIAPFEEAHRVEVTHPIVYIPDLPPAFAGLKIALLTDIHRGPFVSAKRVAHFVEMTNAEKPDVIALTGDYVHRSKRYIPSVWSELSHLKAPLGVYAVLGNHDYWESGEMSLKALQKSGITNLTNRSVPVERGGQKLFIAGVDDSWAGKPDLSKAMEGLGKNDTAILLCHNPDYIEKAEDPRAKLWLSGHTHGGQVCIKPGVPIVHPSKCALRYIGGLAKCEAIQIYISRGLGTVSPPIRWNCPAELPIIELRPV